MGDFFVLSLCRLQSLYRKYVPQEVNGRFSSRESEKEADEYIVRRRTMLLSVLAQCVSA